MALRCIKNHAAECDGCGSCSQKETGVIVTATVKLKMEVHGELERMLRAGKTMEATDYAQELVEDAIDCSGMGNEMSIEDVELELDE